MNDTKIKLSTYGFYDFIENKILLSHEWYDRSGVGLEIRKAFQINQNFSEEEPNE